MSNTLFSTSHDGRKISSFSMTLDGNEHAFLSENFKSIVFSGSHHGEYDKFFIVVDGDIFYDINKVDFFEFEATND